MQFTHEEQNNLGALLHDLDEANVILGLQILEGIQEPLTDYWLVVLVALYFDVGMDRPFVQQAAKATLEKCCTSAPNRERLIKSFFLFTDYKHRSTHNVYGRKSAQYNWFLPYKEIYKQLLKIDNRYKNLFFLAACHFFNRPSEHALQHPLNSAKLFIEALLDVDSCDIFALFAASEIAKKHKQYKKAIEYYERILACNLNFEQLKETRRNRRNNRNASSMLQYPPFSYAWTQFLVIPTKMRIQKKYGLLLYDLGQLTEALPLLEAAIKEDDNNPEAPFLEVGKLYARIGDFQKALEIYEKGIHAVKNIASFEIREQYDIYYKMPIDFKVLQAKYYEYRGDIFINQYQEVDKAMYAYKKVLQFDPGNTKILKRKMLLAYHIYKDIFQAEHFANKLLKYTHNDPLVLEYLKKIKKSRGY